MSAAQTVQRLERAMREAAEEHNYFQNIYPKEIAARTAKIFKFSLELEYVVKDAVGRHNLHALDFADAIILPPFEKQIDFLRSVARRGRGGWE
jgi:hypothetical protein